MIEVVVKLGCLNTRPDHLSRIKIGKEPINLEEGLPNAQLFDMHVTDGYFEYIIHFLTTDIAPKEYSIQ